MNAKKVLLTALVIVILASFAFGAYEYNFSHASALKAAPSMAVPARAPLGLLPRHNPPSEIPVVAMLKAAPAM